MTHAHPAMVVDLCKASSRGVLSEGPVHVDAHDVGLRAMFFYNIYIGMGFFHKHMCGVWQDW